MQVTDSQLQLIFRYFDGDLSDEEEQQLLQHLQQNAALQQAFDEQVLLHRFEQPGATGAKATAPDFHLEPADDFIRRVTDNGNDKNGTVPPVVPLKQRTYRWLVAAAAVVAGLVIGLWLLQNSRKPTPGPIVKTPVKDTATLVKIPVQPPPQDSLPTEIVETVSLQDLYSRYYAVFPPNNPDVPQPATPYSSQYDQKQYADLAIEKESSLDVKGQEDSVEEQTALLYFRFYKALANLHTGKPAEAEKLLKKVTASGMGPAPLIQQANWYLLLVYLKKEDKKNSLLLAQKFSHNKQNPYYQKAAAIEEALSR